jgi:HPt (histidine-containing phosphotransfer) domain-containing protein
VFETDWLNIHTFASQRNTMDFTKINLNYLHTMSDQDPEMVATVLGMLIAELPVEVAKLDKLISSKNWTEVHLVSHKLKSTLSFVGSEEMTKYNTAIMDSAKRQSSLGDIKTWSNQLVALLPVVMTELNTALKSY